MSKLFMQSVLKGLTLGLKDLYKSLIGFGMILIDFKK